MGVETLPSAPSRRQGTWVSAAARVFGAATLGCVAFYGMMFVLLPGPAGLILTTSAVFVAVIVSAVRLGRTRPSRGYPYLDLSLGLLFGVSIAAAAYAYVLQLVLGLNSIS